VIRWNRATPRGRCAMDERRARRLHQRLRDAFEAAIRADGAERGRVLDGFCEGEPALRLRLEAMLRAAERGLTTPLAVPKPLVRESPPAPARIPGLGPLVAIGCGGMGEVFESIRLHDGRRVAVKIPRPRELSSPQRRRFLREAAILARLRHPTIVRLLGRGDLAGVPYMVLELVEEGCPIDEHAARLQLDLPAILGLIAEVADGLAHAHALGFVHRDLKPRNLLVDRHGRPHLLDFGIAKVDLSNLEHPIAPTGSAEVLGSLEAMSPEQLRLVEAPVDARSDIYQLALLLYRLVSRDRPPSGGGGTASLSLRLAARNGRIGALAGEPRMARRLRRVLEAALRFHPADRHQRMEAFAADLREIRAGVRGGVRAPRAVQRLLRRLGMRG
jgi:serine/threonine protein kinase